MADAAYIQSKIYYGYGKAATHLGLDYTFYHPTNPIDPLNVANQIGTLKVSLNVAWSYMKANKYGNAIWQTVADGRDSPLSVGFTIGDYFQGTSLNNQVNTYFIISKQLILPILSVECNKFITITRAEQDNQAGFNGSYSGYTPASSTILASNMPVSMLEITIGRENKQKLPTDTLMPRWWLLMPNLGDVTYKNRDIVIDQLGMRYVIATTEKTDFGWRCQAELLGA